MDCFKEIKLSPKEVVSRRHLSVKPNQTLLEKSSNWSNPQSKIRAKLQNFGHKIKTSNFSSGLALIHWQSGQWHGAADPRREGQAVSLP